MITYHYIGDEQPGSKAIPWDRFEDQVRALPNHTFTFDDGLACHYQAADILERHGKRGVFSIIGSTLDGAAPVAHMLHCAAASHSWSDLIAMSGLHVEPNPAYAYAGHDEAIAKTIYNMTVTPDAARAILGPLCSINGWFVNREQIADLASRGHHILSHGYSHNPLSRMTYEDATDDLLKSRQVLGSLMTDSLVMVLPFGCAPPPGALESAGFLCGIGTSERIDCMRVQCT